MSTSFNSFSFPFFPHHKITTFFTLSLLCFEPVLRACVCVCVCVFDVFCFTFVATSTNYVAVLQ